MVEQRAVHAPDLQAAVVTELRRYPECTAIDTVEIRHDGSVEPATNWTFDPILKPGRTLLPLGERTVIAVRHVLRRKFRLIND